MMTRRGNRAAGLYGVILMIPIYIVTVGAIMNRVQTEASSGRLHLAGFRAELAAENVLLTAFHRNEWLGPARIERMDLPGDEQLWLATGWHELPNGHRIERSLRVTVRWVDGVATIVRAEGFAASDQPAR